MSPDPLTAAVAKPVALARSRCLILIRASVRLITVLTLASFLCPNGAPGVSAQEPASVFDHGLEEHQQECSECHRRSTSDVLPSFPVHSACLVCHATDFGSPDSPLCAGCHVVPLDGQATLLAFPTDLRDFGVGFSHQQHLQGHAASSAATAESTAKAECQDCHAFAASHPEGSFPGHVECYSCHEHQEQGEQADCGSCHMSGLGPSLSHNVGDNGTAFRTYGFTHESHLLAPSVRDHAAGCAVCHEVSASVLPTGQDIKRIQTERGQQHSSTCFDCHKQEQEPYCTKCHAQGPPMSLPVAIEVRGRLEPQLLPGLAAFLEGPKPSLAATDSHVRDQ